MQSGATSSSIVMVLVGLFLVLRGFNGSLASKIRGATGTTGTTGLAGAGGGAAVLATGSSGGSPAAQPGGMPSPVRRAKSPVIVTSGGVGRRGGH